jgi:hypothetical protein
MNRGANLRKSFHFQLKALYFYCGDYLTDVLYATCTIVISLRLHTVSVLHSGPEGHMMQ